MAIVGYLNGLSWTARIGWTEVYVGLFVLVIAYALAFRLVQSKFSWLIAAGICAVLANALAFRAILQAGLVGQRMAITATEWFVSAAIAGVLAQLVPQNTGKPPRKKSTYY
jgi:hypothetical protein